MWTLSVWLVIVSLYLNLFIIDTGAGSRQWTHHVGILYWFKWLLIHLIKFYNISKYLFPVKIASLEHACLCVCTCMCTHQYTHTASLPTVMGMPLIVWQQIVCHLFQSSPKKYKWMFQQIFAFSMISRLLYCNICTFYLIWSLFHVYYLFSLQFCQSVMPKK